MAPLRRKAEMQRRPTKTSDRRGHSTAVTPARGEARCRTRAELGSQPTESEFEEITADTLLGPHFVRPSPVAREVGTVRGTRAREKLGSNAGSWDHPDRPLQAARDVRPGRGIERGKLGSRCPGHGTQDGMPRPRGDQTREVGIIPPGPQEQRGCPSAERDGSHGSWDQSAG